MKSTSFVSVFVIHPAPAGWEFLQILRAPGRYMEGTWQLVSGGIEENEPAWRAALRELSEETDLTPIEFYHLDSISTFYLPHIDSVCHAIPFCAIVPADAPVTLNHEHLKFRWIPQDQIEENLVWPGQKTTCREVISEIIGNGASKAYCRIKI